MPVLSTDVTMALRLAEALAGSGSRGVRAPVTPVETVAIGDCQAAPERVFEILSAHELLTADGWLRPHVRLISVGDHFDYGKFDSRAQAAEGGLQVLSWLAAHPPNQVTILAGNHDLARVGELALLDDERFRRAATAADQLYRRGSVADAEHAAFLRAYPELPTLEVAARDLSSFRVAQRELVRSLLTSGRMRLAVASHSVLVTHAGITRADLEGIDPSLSAQPDASSAAAALNRALDAALARWNTTDPLEIDGLHHPGSATRGEGGGILYHRPCHPSMGEGFHGRMRRRFDPRSLPLGIAQAIGHVRDAKCRTLLRGWVTDEEPHAEGRLRQLTTDGTEVNYRTGLSAVSPRDACLMFLDGGMNYCAAGDYELLDLSTRRPRRRCRSSFGSR